MTKDSLINIVHTIQEALYYMYENNRMLLYVQLIKKL